jgi:FkbM family methyltransferase
MYQAHGWWFPDQDTHFAEMLTKNISKGGGAVYQEPARMRSIEQCPRRRVAVDIGANVGLWTRDLCHWFEQVIAVEPVEEFRQCLLQNVSATNLEIQPVALGATATTINMIITENNTGHSHVDVSSMGQGTVPMITLDSLNLACVDYIKIDCEGFENNILLGAKETICQHRPIVVIEDKKHKDVGHTDTDSALNTLLSWGACVIKTVNNDRIVGWP